jgi:PAS domain S-box-containing protein
MPESQDRRSTCRGRIRTLALLLALVATLALCPPVVAAAAPRTVRVGVYENEPKEFTGAGGQPSGIFIDLVKAIAADEGWTLVWVNGTFAQGLASLESGGVDLMPDVAYTSDRALKYDFNKTPVVQSWSYVYAAPGQQVELLSDLVGERVAVLSGSVQETEFTQMIKGFGLSVTIVPVATLKDAFDAAAHGRADAAIANHFFGDYFFRQYGLTRTPIVFNPSPLYYATAKGRNADLLAAVDTHLNDWIRQPNSVYYQVLDRYTSGTSVAAIPPYLFWVLGVVATLLVAAIAVVLLLRWRVRVKTRRLVETETELKLALESLRFHIDNSPMATIQFDSDMRITDWSQNAERMFGYAAGEVLGRTLHELGLVCEEDAEQVDAVFADMLASGTVSGVHTNRNYRKDGTVLTVEWYNSLLKGAEGRLVSVESRGLDITERERSLADIRRQRAALTALLEVSRTLAATLEMGSVLRTIVYSAVELSGLDSGAIYLIEGEDLVLGTAVPPLAERFKGLLGRVPLVDYPLIQHAFDTGLPVLMPDVATATLSQAERAITEARGIRSFLYLPLLVEHRPVGVLVLGASTEPRSFTAEELDLFNTLCGLAALAVENARLFEQTVEHARTLEAKVVERTAELSVALDKAKEVDRLKSMFVATMSHELRTPLNSIIGFSSVLQNEWGGPLNDEQHENVAIVMRAGKHLLALINDVIDVSKIEAGKVEITAEDFDLADAVGETAEMVRELATEKGLSLSVDAAHVDMHTDRRRLVQCLLNLAGNAVKFTETGGVHIEARGADGGDIVEIAVADTGIGIPEEKRSELFGAFVRIDSPLRDKVPGTGLGLHLAQKLAREILGGTVEYADRPTGGSIFTLRVPARMGG